MERRISSFEEGRSTGQHACVGEGDVPEQRRRDTRAKLWRGYNISKTGKKSERNK